MARGCPNFYPSETLALLLAGADVDMFGLRLYRGQLDRIHMRGRRCYDRHRSMMPTPAPY